MSDLERDLGRDDDDGRDDSMPPDDGDPKASSSTQVRKAQNRIAQREFRLRKQQYIRDLEARVEVLSGDKEERVELMTLLVRNLLKENKELRGMVKSMAAFVGEGLGSCLPRLGLSSGQLDAILNRADTDTAYEAFVNLKASREQTNSNPGIVLGQPRRKPSDSPATMKRKHDSLEEPSPPATGRGKWKPRSGSSGGKSGPREDGGPAGGESRSTSGTPRGGIYRERPVSLSTPPRDGYDFLFPDLDTLWGDVPADADVNGAAPQSSSNSNRVFQERPYAQTSQHGYAQRLMSADDMMPDDRPQPQPQPRPQPQPQPQPPLQNATAMLPGTDLSGFGLTLPASSSESGRREIPMSSLAGPRPNTTGFLTSGNYALSHQSIMSPNANVSDPERQKQLSDAVATITHMDNAEANQGSGAAVGPGMTAAEVAERRRQQDQLAQTIAAADPADMRLETMQLITYHLNNFRLNHEYHLPPSLRPTAVQRTIPHEHAIDGIIFPSVRDRMILLRGQYDLVEVFHAMLKEFVLHGDDVLDHNNYEVSEKFIEDYSILVDDQVLTVTNKWRAQRGAPALSRAEKESEPTGHHGHRIGQAH